MRIIIKVNTPQLCIKCRLPSCIPHMWNITQVDHHSYVNDAQVAHHSYVNDTRVAHQRYILPKWPTIVM